MLSHKKHSRLLILTTNISTNLGLIERNMIQDLCALFNFEIKDLMREKLQKWNEKEPESKFKVSCDVELYEIQHKST